MTGHTLREIEDLFDNAENNGCLNKLPHNLFYDTLANEQNTDIEYLGNLLDMKPYYNQLNIPEESK